MFAENIQVKESKIERAKFDLDVSKIELHSAHKRKILLPYSGPLPDALQNNDGAHVLVNPTVGLTIHLCLVVMMDEKEHRYPIKATTKEKNDLLFSFFFEDADNGKFNARKTGLNSYWMGSYQSSYIHWRRFVYEGHSLEDVIDQLSPDEFNRVARYISKHAKTA